MSANLVELRKKRTRAATLAEMWQKEIIKATRKLAAHRRREKLYTTLIEKALAEKQQTPKDPKRIVEV